ncbi:hypothetical protein K502DRAFT_366156 [Neoconidiobolus thromboides FSU 785]|nr:hypothetical protein K502DRAFT_366156 [Neoconidiobolus thromboides FSU 785]
MAKLSDQKSEFSLETEVRARAGRPVRVCDQCRRSRRKCNSKKPSCSLCIRRRKQCTYDQVEYKKETGLNVETVVKQENIKKNIEEKMRELIKQKEIKTNSRTMLMLSRSSTINLEFNPLIFFLASWKKEIPAFLHFIKMNDSNFSQPIQHSKTIVKKESLIEGMGFLSNYLVLVFFRDFNPFFPIIDETCFLTIFFNKLWLKDEAFKLLVNVIHLTALSFHPDCEVIQEHSLLIERHIKLSLKKQYLKPSIYLVQSLTILSMQNNISEKDGLMASSSFFLGLAYKHAITLGLHQYHQDKSKRSSYQRTWWGIAIVEQLLMHCTGRPPILAICDRQVQLKDLAGIKRKKDLLNEFEKTYEFHLFVFVYSRLISRYNIIKEEYYPKNNLMNENIRQEEIKLDSNLQKEKEKKFQCFIKHRNKLEFAFHCWFKYYFKLNEDSGFLLSPILLNNDLDLNIYIDYYSALHDIYSTHHQFNHNSTILNNLNMELPTMTLREFSSLTGEEKRVIAAYFGAYTIMYGLKRNGFIFRGTIYKWWSASQFMFTLLTFSEKNKNSSFNLFCQAYLKFMLTCLKEGKSRFASLANIENKATTIYQILS